MPHTAEAREEPGPGSQLASGEQIALDSLVSELTLTLGTRGSSSAWQLTSDMRQHLSSAVMASAD